MSQDSQFPNDRGESPKSFEQFNADFEALGFTSLEGARDYLRENLHAESSREDAEAVIEFLEICNDWIARCSAVVSPHLIEKVPACKFLSLKEGEAGRSKANYQPPAFEDGKGGRVKLDIAGQIYRSSEGNLKGKFVPSLEVDLGPGDQYYLTKHYRDDRFLVAAKIEISNKADKIEFLRNLNKDEAVEVLRRAQQVIRDSFNL